jgi:chromosomal replication initiation ATPase DnaA
MENYEIEEKKVKDFAVNHLKEVCGVDVFVHIVNYSDTKNFIIMLIKNLAFYRQLTYGRIIGPEKTREYVYFRFQTICVIRQLLPKISLSQIGVALGSRDHSTIIHATKVNQDLCDTDKAYKAKYDEMLQYAKDFLGK